MGKHDVKSDVVELNHLRSKEQFISLDKPIRQTNLFEYGDFDLVPKWLVVSLIGQSIPVAIEKIGTDVVDGKLDLSGEVIPDLPKNPTVYVNDIAGSYTTQFNKSSKIISGLDGIDPADIIEIIF